MQEEELNKVLQNLEVVNKTIQNLDPVIKVAAFEMLKPLILGDSLNSLPPANPAGVHINAAKKVEDEVAASADTSSLATFFEGIKDKSPAGNVCAIFAWFYSQRGVTTITVEDVENLANQVGLTVPSRIDMTLKQNSSFRKVGKGFELTVQGELYVKKTYGVKKGVTQPVVQPAA